MTGHSRSCPGTPRSRKRSQDSELARYGLRSTLRLRLRLSARRLAAPCQHAPAYGCRLSARFEPTARACQGVGLDGLAFRMRASAGALSSVVRAKAGIYGWGKVWSFAQRCSAELFVGG